MRILISAGEVSGDIAGARVARAILERRGGELFGLGGTRMQNAGVELLASATHLGTVGVSESLRVVPAMLAPARAIRRLLSENPPDAALLIGNDIFNVLLGRWCRSAGVPTVCYFPPQVWIWRAVAWLFSKSFDVVVASFPEEVEAYSKHVRTEYVGHYLADVLDPQTDESRAVAQRELELQGGSTVVTLLPGSRHQEIRSLGRLLLAVASRVIEHHPDITLLLPLSDRTFESEIAALIEAAGLTGRIRIVSDSHLAMRASDLVLAASGTATLEATLLGVPMVVVYQVSRLTHAVVRAAIMVGLMRSETVALPNILLGRHVVPEFTQSRVTVESVTQAALSMLDDADLRDGIRRDLLSARELISRKGTIESVVDVIEHAAASRQAVPSAAGTVRAPGEPHVTRGRP